MPVAKKNKKEWNMSVSVFFTAYAFIYFHFASNNNNQSFQWQSAPSYPSDRFGLEC